MNGVRTVWAELQENGVLVDVAVSRRDGEVRSCKLMWPEDLRKHDLATAMFLAANAPRTR